MLYLHQYRNKSLFSQRYLAARCGTVVLLSFMLSACGGPSSVSTQASRSLSGQSSSHNDASQGFSSSESGASSEVNATSSSESSSSLISSSSISSSSINSSSSSSAESFQATFIAQGHLGRLSLSCDDGLSWPYDQSDATDNATCWSGSNEVECDHTPSSGRGLAFGGGYFYATFGWGYPASIRRSADGQNWQTVFSAQNNAYFGGVIYSEGVLLAVGRTAYRSTDRGETWSDAIDVPMQGYNVRRAAAIAQQIIVVGDNGDIVLSNDQGLTWFAPSQVASGCGADIQFNGGIAYGNNTILLLGADGSACYSRDQGLSFQIASVGGNVDSQLVWNGNEFVAYGLGQMYRSSNGSDWSSVAMQPSLNIGALAISPEGTYVGVEGGWGESVWYENQEFYRSTDGIHWQSLAADQFTGSHPITHIQFGELNSSCSFNL